MIRDLGIVKPGTTLYIPWHTFDSNDPTASVTMTGLATTDIEIYKDGGTTQRASDAGYALLDTDGTDFDSITGIHGISIDLADNTTANFYEAGSQYWIVISSVTVDSGAINFVLATFRIGYPNAILNTTIATLASQTSFTLEDGSADDNAYNGCPVYIHDLASAVQVAIGYVSDYTGSTKTITLAADPGIFTMAAGDNVSFFMPSNVHAISEDTTAAANLETACDNYSATRGLAGTALPAAAADAAGGLPISDAGGLDLDAMNTNINDIETDTNELQTDFTNDGRLDLILDELTTQGDTNESKIDTIDTNVDAVLVDTNELQTDLTDGGRLDLLIDAVLEDTGELQTDWADDGRLDFIVDAILADTDALQQLFQSAFAEITSKPATGAALADKLAFLFHTAVNKSTFEVSGDTGTLSIKQSDGSTELASRTSTDDGTIQTTNAIT